jgi:nucleoside 2-deoxyribosyltransferase
MQFNTPEYEALFTEIITPVCEKEGFSVYRADFTKRPGLIISDITKHLTESQVIIGEVTPLNGNVYYEVGYADALKKPVVLIADKTVGQLPFDIRPYRTIFYENSIGGKRTVEETLSQYLKNILTPQSF